MTKLSILDFHRSKFNVGLFNLFEDHPDLMAATCCGVKSSARREIFARAVKGLERDSVISPCEKPNLSVYMTNAVVYAVVYITNAHILNADICVDLNA
jgi:hypothetical protein